MIFFKVFQEKAYCYFKIKKLKCSDNADKE